jgi:hypothetical protein
MSSNFAKPQTAGKGDANTIGSISCFAAGAAPKGR